MQDTKLADRILDSIRDSAFLRNSFVTVPLTWWVGAVCLLYYALVYLYECLFHSISDTLLVTSYNDENMARKMRLEFKQLLESARAMQVIQRIRTEIGWRKKLQCILESNHYSIQQWWKQHCRAILENPPCQELSHTCDISLIVPAYREKGANLQQTLNHALSMCENPSSVQVLIVNAGQCTDLPEALDDWFEFRLVDGIDAVGRGSSLNRGARYATGRFLTFLHADTLLPQHWDTKIKKALHNSVDKAGGTIQACAFRFGTFCSQTQDPAGMTAIRLFGNWRARYLHMPYGDHVLSFPRSFFEYLGTFHNEPIMEDFQLMYMLRCRALHLSERIRIIPGDAAQCSDRRWVQNGVMYVTLANALLVYRYTLGGWSATQIYEYYYQKRKHKKKD